MRILHMALPSLALAVLLGLGLACLQGQAALASSCDPKNDRMVINFPGLGKIVTTRGELEDAWQQYVDSGMAEFCEQAFNSPQENDDLTSAMADSLPADYVFLPSQMGAQPDDDIPLSQTRPPFNHAGYVMWCMMVFMEEAAQGNK